ncbi:MAG TPA: hypothetical protein VG992_00555 [Candidatus Saccharimonadales bacterium]|nr:hypothetical protein [Candidatus Saccharimonadales bacterium]
MTVSLGRVRYEIPVGAPHALGAVREHLHDQDTDQEDDATYSSQQTTQHKGDSDR